MRSLLPPILVTLLLLIGVPLGVLAPIAGRLPWPLRVLGVVVAVAGVGLTVSSARRFEQTGTNIKTFDEPDELVRTGAFRYTRNPMYLGFLGLLVGVALLVGSASVWIAPIGFWVASQFWYIPFEERRMAASFGESYDRYRREVPRWVGMAR